MSDKRHNDNPDVRPPEQNIKRQAHEQMETPPEPRSFKTGFNTDFLQAYHQGVMNYTYKGVSCLKSPIDLAIYMKLIWDKKPGTIVEIGSYKGGAAKFYYDLTRCYGLTTDIITVDFRDIGATEDASSPIEFIQADAQRLEESALPERLKSAARPWLIIEDSAHTFSVTLAVMDYFKAELQPGEMLIIEDGVIEDQGGNWRYDGGPNRAVHTFFQTDPTCFRIAHEYNDFFGENVTFNPNGYLEKL